MTPGFANRTDAAHQLAAHLQHLRPAPRGVVLAVPRGGVPMGAIVAKALGWPLDVVLTKKIGHPAHPEYAVGAVSLESVVLTPGVVLPDGYLDEQVAHIRQRLQQRHQAYVGNRPPLVLTGRTVVLVDDGVATGHTLLATVELVRQQAPARVVVAVPVSSTQALGRLQAVADEVVCLLAPPDFQAVGQFYRDFTQVTDEEVMEALHAAERPPPSARRRAPAGVARRPHCDRPPMPLRLLLFSGQRFPTERGSRIF